jgi:PEGA domain
MTRKLSGLVMVGVLLTCVPSRAQSPSAEGKQEVRALLDQVAEGLGGWDRIRSVRAFRLQQTIRTPFRTFQTDSIALPDRLRQEDNLFGYLRATIIAPQLAVTIAAGQVDYRLSAAEKEGWENNNLRFNVIYLLQKVTDGAYQFSVLGSERVGEVETRILEVRGYGARHLFYIDPTTGRALREMQYDADGSRSSADYSRWVSAGGFIFPAQGSGTIQNASGQSTSLQAEITAVEINPRIDYRWFERYGGALTSVPIHPLAMLPAPDLPRTAALHLNTYPGNAQAYVNDEFRGSSGSDGNLVISNLKPGTYGLRVTLAGHQEWKQSITLAAGENRAVEVKFASTGPKPLTLAEVEKLLRDGVPKTRVATLVREYGVDFDFSDEVEAKLRAATADDSVLLAVSTSRRR